MGNKPFCTAGTITCPGRAPRLGGLSVVGSLGPPKSSPAAEGGVQFSQFHACLGRLVPLNYQRCIFTVVCFPVGRGTAAMVCV